MSDREAIQQAIRAMEWMLCDYEHLNSMGQPLSANWPQRVQAVKDAVAKLQAAQAQAGDGESYLLAKNQDCGCVICTCENDERCMGCGAKHCGTHPIGQIPNPRYEQTQAGDGESPVGRAYYTTGDFLDVDWYTSDIPDDAFLYTRSQPAQVNRQDLINLLIATRTQSEGVTADLIINLLDAKPQVNQQLLEALQDLLAYVEQGIGDIESDEGRKARAAIAAAQEGK